MILLDMLFCFYMSVRQFVLLRTNKGVDKYDEHLQ